MSDRPLSDVSASRDRTPSEVDAITAIEAVKERIKTFRTAETAEAIQAKVSPSIVASKEARKSRRLQIIERVLLGVGIGFFVSIAITCGIIYLGKPTPPELIVLNTVLGSTLTTLVGVVAGTSID
ncbi:MAG: hypothetical protein ACR2PW_02645 [Gammaproteobacteria bacterium]